MRFFSISKLGFFLFVFLNPLSAFSNPERAYYLDENKNQIFFEIDYSLGAFTIEEDKDPAYYIDYYERFELMSKRNLSGLFNLNIVAFELDAFSSMSSQSIGTPVWFDREHGAVGVLTSEIVVELVETAKLEELRPHLEFVKNIVESTFKPRFLKLTFADPQQALLASYHLSQLNIVLYAHPNFLIPKEDRSSSPIQDSYFQEQWHLENTKNNAGSPGADIKARQAWEITEGSANITIAIIDGGFDVEHKDLKYQWRVNSKETPGNNKDDDHNGLMDDYIGWDFGRKYSYLRNKPNHGTAVAGLIAAEKNDVGTIGSCPLCKMIPLVYGSTPFEDAEAFYYAKQRGADIISNSWGYPIGTPNTPAVVSAINDVAARGRGGKGMVIFFAMTNSHRDNCIGDKPDISSLSSVIAISGSDHKDQRVYGSGYGKCLKLLAPTRKDSSSQIGIVTTDVTGKGGYNFFGGTTELTDFDYTKTFSGTSAATPIAAGVAGLLLAQNPLLTRQEVLTKLTKSADKIESAQAKYNSSGFSETYGYGRLNAFGALQQP